MKKFKLLIIIITVVIVVGTIFVVRFFWTAPHASHNEESEVSSFYCPMHPEYISNKPGNCPICGMNLVKAEPKNEHNNNQKTVGMAQIIISPEKQQLIGLKTAVVKYRKLTNIISVPGKVAFDPELYNAINEYREAVKQRGDKPNTVSPIAKSAYTKLLMFGFNEQQITELAAQDNSSLILPANTAWIYADIYSADIANIAPGLETEITSDSYPGTVFNGKIKAVHPMADPVTRTIRVHIETTNSNRKLKQEMYVNVKIIVVHGTKLTVDDEAVLDTGKRKIVFVALDNNLFEPREIVTGLHNDDYYEIIKGLSNGERVVNSANFLVDSESKLKSIISNMSK